ncbi:major facilitator superfamily domain-containing protein [Leucosporidium creatinivorum]|uniref:Major facilitator superfamily domain-containing protein n=1 Tax=Leucosporidium creatinivorum TaxID=106004 RepID=A0A1Y2EPI9_9BASI|nr:major facilitator superfamily domain-containing protein [Leucosporidium creatinivorum]
MTTPAVPALDKRIKGDESPRSTDSKTELESDFKSDVESREDADSIWNSVFDDPLLAKYYEPPEEYEGKHRFDPSARWTPEEEKKILRKVDLRVCLFVCLCFAALQLDRGNIGQAISDNMLGDLGLSTNDYNLGQTIFYVSFLFMELPSQLISKWLGVDRWIPFQMVAWSVVAISQYTIKGKTGFFVTRALLGALEGGFIPDMVLLLSYWYRARELNVRLAWFWVSLTVTTIIGSFLAAGILKMRGVKGVEGWRYLFLIEGFITLTVGVVAVFYLPPSPVQTASFFRGKKGWFNEREETILVMRVLRDDPTKSSMHNRQPIGLRDLWKSISDFDLIGCYLLGMTSFVAPSTVGAYFTLTLRSLGFSTFNTNLLVIPGNVLFIINNLGLTFLSRHLGEHLLVGSIGAWWQLILLIVLVAIPDNLSAWGKYVILTLLVAWPYAHPILVGLNSHNSGSVRTRSVSASLYNIGAQLGGIIASNIYHTDEKPYYRRGNKVLLGIVSLNILIFLSTKAYFVLRNRHKRAKWAALSPEERRVYLETTKDEGNRRLDFIFKH